MQAWFESLKADFELNFIQGRRWTYLVDGLGATLTITLLAGLLGIAIGVVIAMIRSTYDKTAEGARKTLGRRLFGVVDKICRVYLTVIRGTPVVVQLMIIYFVIFAWSNNGTMIAALAFGLNSGAYVAEIVRGGIMSIDNGSSRPAAAWASIMCRRCGSSSSRRRSRTCCPRSRTSSSRS